MLEVYSIHAVNIQLHIDNSKIVLEYFWADLLKLSECCGRLAGYGQMLLVKIDTTLFS
jgi:hypothetical protein